MKILFVCTGNTCRSPMAKAIAEAAFKKTGVKAAVSSAGTSVFLSQPASKHAIGAAKKNKLKLTGHRSRAVTAEDIADSDLIFTMTNGHKNFLLINFPGHENKIRTLYEYARGTEYDVDDPFGRDAAHYEFCFNQLSELISELAVKLQKAFGEEEKPI